jgi:putative ABC transport system permease protein
MVGVALAYGGTRALSYLMLPYTIPLEAEIKIRIPVLLFTVASAAVTALLFGVAPALHLIRRDLARGLSGAGKGEGSGSNHGNLRNLLVTAEVALSLLLVFGAGALMRSLLSIMDLDLGFNPHNIVGVRPRIPNATPAQRRHFVEMATLRLGGLPE